MKRLSMVMAFVLGAASNALAQTSPQVMVAPTRLILGGRTRSAELSLINPGATSVTYRISLSHVRMKEDGSVKEAVTPAPEELATEELIRFSPRQVVLDPQIAQTVRVQVKPKAELPPGEYRVNLVVRAVPGEAAALPPGAKKDEFGISVSILYGVSIPIIIRQGDTAATATLSDLAVDNGVKPALAFRINRSGNRSLFGNLTAKFTPHGGKEQVAAIQRGVAVYSDLASRKVVLPLQPGMKLEHGKIDLTYVDGEGSEATLARASLEVP